MRIFLSSISTSLFCKGTILSISLSFAGSGGVLSVDYVQGHNPDLFFYDEQGTELEKIDLAPFSTEEIIDLLITKGFHKVQIEEHHLAAARAHEATVTHTAVVTHAATVTATGGARQEF